MSDWIKHKLAGFCYFLGDLVSKVQGHTEVEVFEDFIYCIYNNLMILSSELDVYNEIWETESRIGADSDR